MKLTNRKNKVIKLVREIEKPLFYIQVEDMVISKGRGIQILKPANTVSPNFYRRGGEFPVRFGESKGEMKGYRKEIVGYTTVGKVSVDILHGIEEGKIEYELLN